MKAERICHRNCKFLNITESEQDRLAIPHVPHIYKRYDRRVFHHNNHLHPDLARLDECDYDGE